MIQVTYYTEMPEQVQVENLGEKKTGHIWLRKNIKEIERRENIDGEEVVQVEWMADEAYFEQVNPKASEIDLETWWEYAASWQPGMPEKDVLGNKELTEKCNELQTGQLDIYDAVATIYETVLGEVN